MRDALATALARVRVWDREGTLALDLGGDRVHFDPGSAALHVLDAGRRRPATLADVAAMVRLVDGLPRYAAQSTALVPSDVPPRIADRARLYLAIKLGRKPVVTGTFQKDGFAPMRAMLVAIRGSDQALRERPLAIFDCCPSPPLQWSDLTAQALVDCGRSGIPAELVSMPLAGATAPVTLREAAVLHAAENLSGIAIHQAAAPGAPIIWGGAPAAFDMRRGTTAMGAMETVLIDLDYVAVGKALSLPTHAYLAVSDAKVPDYQAGMETGMGAALAALAGINLISGPGMLDFLLTLSLEKILLDHEALGLALRLSRGIERRECDAVALLADLVRTSCFLGHPHTRRHWREELELPSALVDRDPYPDWEARGSRWAHERASEELARRLESSGSPLDEPRSNVLDAVLREYGLEAIISHFVHHPLNAPDRRASWPMDGVTASSPGRSGALRAAR